MKILGFVKVRNEIIREGNLYDLLQQLDRFCDGGVICDDASTDGTREVILEWLKTRPFWMYYPVKPEEQDFSREMLVKEEMMKLLHKHVHHGRMAGKDPLWILWLDADELLLTTGETFREWLETHGDEADIWGFHYTQPWRTLSHARTDSGFDDGVFWKLWRYRPDLAFETKAELHTYQFPKNYVGEVLDFVNPRRRRAPPGIAQRQRQPGRRAIRLGLAKPPPEPPSLPVTRAQRAPFEVLHVGNVGKSLVWKAIVYRDSGRLAEASLKRHLYFGAETTYRPLIHTTKEEPVPFTDEEKTLIERMGRLRGTEGLVTIIVPTYNRGRLLDRTLDSVLVQTYKNWVCVVLDDGSTDHTPEIMRTWQDRDPRFFYCRYETNRGGVAMNEIGMALACEFGEFWTRLGSDDYWKPEKLMLDITAFDREADVVYGPYVDLREDKASPEGRDIRNAPHDARKVLLEGRFAVSWANMAVRTKVLRRLLELHGRFADPRLRNMEDYIVNVRLAELADFTFRGLTVDGECLIGLHKVHPSHLVPDAVWRIGADGASSNDAVCAADNRITRELIATQRKPVFEEGWVEQVYVVEPARFPWRQQQPILHPLRPEPKCIALADYTETHVCVDKYGEQYETVMDAVAAGHEQAYAVTRCTYPKPTSAADIIYGMCEELHDDAADGLDEEKLQALLDIWYDNQDPKGAGFVVDENTIVVLR